MAKNYKRSQYGLGDGTTGAPDGYQTNTGMRNTGRSRATSYEGGGAQNGAKPGHKNISGQGAYNAAQNAVARSKALHTMGTEHPDYPTVKKQYDYDIQTLENRHPRAAHYTRTIIGLERQHAEAKKQKQDTRHIENLLKIAKQGLKDVTSPPEQRTRKTEDTPSGNRRKNNPRMP
jgi:hypothetical protein